MVDLSQELWEVFKSASPGHAQAQASHAQAIKLDSLGVGSGDQ